MWATFRSVEVLQMNLVNTSAFDELLSRTAILVADFSSPGCGPCKKVPPFIEEVLSELNDPGIAACEVSVAASMDLAQRYMVMGVPTIIVFKNGIETTRFSSLPKKEKLLAALKG